MKKVLALLLSFVMTSMAVASTEVKILRQPGQSSNMLLLYPTVENFEKMAKKQGIDVKVILQPLGNVSSGVTSMLAGNTDIIMGAVIPFAFANDKAPGRLQLLSGSASQNMDLICSNPEIKTVKDIKPTHKIAMKNLGSSEQFMLRQISRKFFNDYFYLDNNIVTMPRTQIASLMAGKDKSIDCAIPGTPLQGSLVKDKHAHHVFSSNQVDVMGNVHGTFASTEWIKKNPKLAEIWIAAVKKTALELEKNLDKSVDLFRKMDDVKDSATIVKETVIQAKQKHTVEPVGIYAQLVSLYEMGVIKNKPAPVDQLIWRKELLK